MRLPVRLLALLLCATGLLPAGAGSARAAAAGPACTSHTLSPADELDVTAAGGAVVPRSVAFSIVERCVTAEDTYAWIATARVRTREAEQWWEFTCRKGLIKWSCGDGEFRQLFPVHLETSGRIQGLQAISHGQEPEEHVRSLATAALQIYANPAAHLAECSRLSADARDWSTLPGTERALPADGPVDADVWHKGDADVVDFNLQMRFVFAAEQADPRKPAARCWAYVVLGR